MKKLYLILAIMAMTGSMLPPVAHAFPDQYIQESAAPAVELRVHGRQLEIVNNSDDVKQVIIYALTGQVVKQFDIHHGISAVDLGAGYYIVKVDKLSQRIVIR